MSYKTIICISFLSFVFLHAAHAYDLQLLCGEGKFKGGSKTSAYVPSIFCKILDRSFKRVIAHAELSRKSNPEINQDELILEDLETENTYQNRGLSSILLYHIVDVASRRPLFADVAIVSLSDYSSVKYQTGKPHYTRYGFNQAPLPGDLQRYSMRVKDFLENSENIRRYSFRHPEDQLTISSEIVVTSGKSRDF